MSVVQPSAVPLNVVAQPPVSGAASFVVRRNLSDLVGAGTVSTTASSNTVTGVSTTFLSFYKPGNVIIVNGSVENYVSEVVSDTVLRCVDVFTSTLSTVTHALKANPITAYELRINPALYGAIVLDISDVEDDGAPSVKIRNTAGDFEAAIGAKSLKSFPLDLDNMPVGDPYQQIRTDITGATAELFDNNSNQVVVAQVTHGLTVGNPVYIAASNTFAKAVASTSGAAKVVGVVSTVVDSNSFVLATHGYVTLTTGQWDAVTGGSGGLTPGEVYYLSPSVLGRITTTPPTNSTHFNVPVLTALSTTVGIVSPRRPQLVPIVAANKYYSSTVAMPTVAGTTSFTHGLGGTPHSWACNLVCIADTFSHGYSVGDVIPIAYTGDSGDAFEPRLSASLSADGASIVVSYMAGTPGVVRKNGTTYSTASAANFANNFDLQVTAILLSV